MLKNKRTWIITGIVFGLWFFFGIIFWFKFNPKFSESGQFGDTFGVLNCLFSGMAFAGVIITLMSHDDERKKDAIISQFFKMLDYHQNNINGIVTTAQRLPKMKFVTTTTKNQDGSIKTIKRPERNTDDAKEIKGRKAFAEYKIQIKHLLRIVKEISRENDMNFNELEIADIAYTVFFYGANRDWQDFMAKYLNDYNEPLTLVDKILNKIQENSAYYALGRTNQTDASAYFRNIYNAIKLIDSCDFLSDLEKSQYIKILRAQLSNPELYVLLFNVLSRFGIKWKENNYIVKYHLFDNIPEGYCDGYEPRTFFPES